MEHSINGNGTSSATQDSLSQDTVARKKVLLPLPKDSDEISPRTTSDVTKLAVTETLLLAVIKNFIYCFDPRLLLGPFDEVRHSE